MFYPTNLPVPPLLPASIRRRIPRLYTFRSKSDASDGDTNLHSGLTSLSEPHLASYRPRVMSDPAMGEELLLLRPGTAPTVESPGDREGSDASDGSVSTSEAENISSNPSYATTPVSGKYEVGSGVRWNRVVPAFNLLRNAGYEAQQNQPDIRLVRSLYINAIGYLLDALPTDMTHEETRTITHKLPDSVRASFPPDNSISNNNNNNNGGVLVVQQHPSQERSYVHRLLASSIVQFFLLIQFLLPYAKVFLRQMYQYERSHRLTERLVTATAEAADTLGKGGASLGTAVLGFHEGKVGAAVGEMVSWWVEGIAGGIHEGVGEGMTLLGVVRRPGYQYPCYPS